MFLKEYSSEGMGIIFMIYIFIPQNVFEYLTTTPTFLSSDVDFRLDVLSRLKEKKKRYKKSIWLKMQAHYDIS